MEIVHDLVHGLLDNLIRRGAVFLCGHVRSPFLRAITSPSLLVPGTYRLY